LGILNPRTGSQAPLDKNTITKNVTALSAKAEIPDAKGAAEPGSASKTIAKKFNIPPPKWQSPEQKKDKIELEASAEADSSGKDKATWQQLDLGQSEEVTVGPKGRDSPNKIAEFRNGKQEKPANKTIPEKGESVSKASVKLAILNESGQPGLGRVYEDIIEAAGFKAAVVVDKPKRNDSTAIYYKPGFEKIASQLNDHIPGQQRLGIISWSSRFDIVVFVR